MTKIQKGPFDFITESFTAKQLSKHKVELYGMYLALAFSAMKAEDIITEVWKLTEVVLGYKEMHASMRSNGALLRDAKQYAFATFALGFDKYEKLVTPAAVMSPLAKKDKAIVQLALTYPPLARCLRKHLAAGRVPKSLHELEQETGDALRDKQIKEYAGKFINGKMAFIMKSSNRKFEDLMADCVASAYYGLLRTYPHWTNHGHMLAISKTTLKNRGHNIIKEHAASSRKDLQGDAVSGYTATTVSFDAFEPGVADVMLVSSNVVSSIDGSLVGDGLDWETNRSLDALTCCTSLPPKQRQYLKLLLGHFDREFSVWLGKSNTQLTTEMDFAQYDVQIRTYLRIPEEAAQKFIHSLRIHL